MWRGICWRSAKMKLVAEPLPPPVDVSSDRE